LNSDPLTRLSRIFSSPQCPG